MNTPEKVCCPEFHPEKFDKQTHVWTDKLFMQDSVKQFLHIPLNIGSVIPKMVKKIEDAQAMPPAEDVLMLFNDVSPWKSELFITVSKEIPDGKMAKLSGTFISTVFEGPYQAVPKWIKETNEYIASIGKKALKLYVHYTYCPKCAKKFGRNYGVIFTQVE